MKELHYYILWIMYIIATTPVYIVFAIIHLIGYILIKADGVCKFLIKYSIKLRELSK